MPMTVITISKAPPSLRGDLTKWMQEIATGVYVGNFNSKVREHLWDKVKRDIGNGQATMSYTYRNELGYRFETFQSFRETVVMDGIQLVVIPQENKETGLTKSGFSNASKFRQMKKYSNKDKKTDGHNNYVIIDLETDGLDHHSHRIIEIGAIKVINGNKEVFEALIRSPVEVPPSITKLTGIDSNLLQRDGIDIEDAMEQLLMFIDNLPIVGYSIQFDIDFINSELKRLEKPPIKNYHYDLMKYIKKQKMFMDNYKLETALAEYGIFEKVPHRALSDAQLIYTLAYKVNGFLGSIKQKG